MDMEVAGQWRREWAGTAEYGKIIEGGVTRRVARAMEVLHASAPGTRVRVVRAAYHSTAGPGAPAASCLMHSSRRVISSGFNLLESPTTPSKPLEISSTPLDSSPEYNTDTANYKVTEPDDFDISAPSKWRSSTAGSSVRMPSEESSSADNTSVIDLDARHHRNSPRKYSYDSENSDILHFRRNSARVSPLLDAPAALSTLKYKSLLNGTNDWNSRRKSYSFEDSSPLSETILQSNDTLAMESSTDSGICKSNEIVNDVDDKYFDHKEREHEENFKNWLFKHRSPTYFKENSVKPYRDHDIIVERSFDNNIALQSKGKICITVPMTVETEDDYQYKKSHASDDNGRKAKKVEFCKTEVHFATETGKVNIIATDEKPPPSFDFRKRKSAFVPINGNFEKPITLFGESNNDFPTVRPNGLPIYFNNESGESDDNTASTKSILKNKIPKPKPYLLGENMAFGSSDIINNQNEKQYVMSSVPTAVSLINNQLKSEKRYSDDAMFTTDVNENNTYRTINKGSTISEDIKNTLSCSRRQEKSESDPVKNKFKSFEMSPIQGRAKTRQLKDSDLTYFGIDRKSMYNEFKQIHKNQSESKGIDDLFQSVRLIQQVSRSNSVCNSETESEDTPEYQNIPIRHNFALIPTPKPRTKIDTKPSEFRILKPVIEQDVETNANVSDTRRSRLRRMDETSITNRSLSAPPKSNARFTENSTIHSEGQHSNVLKKETSPTRSRRNRRVIDESFYKKGDAQNMDRLWEERDSLYVNLREEQKSKAKTQESDKDHHRSVQQHVDTTDITLNKKKALNEKESSKAKPETDSIERERKRGSEKRDKERIRTTHHSRLQTGNSSSLENNQDSNKKIRTLRRTEKLATPEYTNEDHRKTHIKQINIQKSSKENTNSKNIDHQQQKEYRNRSSQRRKDSIPVDDSMNRKENVKEYLLVANEAAGDNRHRNASKDKSSRRDISRTRHKQDTNSLENHRKSTTANAKEIIVPEMTPSANSDKHKHSHSKKKEYVINYDDKNGTVSSVCKINPAPGSSKRKKLLKNNNVKDITKHRAPEKIGLRNSQIINGMDTNMLIKIGEQKCMYNDLANFCSPKHNLVLSLTLTMFFLPIILLCVMST